MINNNANNIITRLFIDIPDTDRQNLRRLDATKLQQVMDIVSISSDKKLHVYDKMRAKVLENWSLIVTLLSIRQRYRRIPPGASHEKITRVDVQTAP